MKVPPVETDAEARAAMRYLCRYAGLDEAVSAGLVMLACVNHAELANDSLCGGGVGATFVLVQAPPPHEGDG